MYILLYNLTLFYCKHPFLWCLNRYTEEDEWKNDDEGWEGIVDENEPFTDEEFKEWESEYYDYGNMGGVWLNNHVVL